MEKFSKHYMKKENVDSYEDYRYKPGGGKIVNESEIRNFVCLLEKDKNIKSILDAGAGTGRISKVLINRGYKVTALDNSREMVEKLKKIRGLKVVYGSIFKISKIKKVDAVLSSRVFFHLKKEDIFKVINEFDKIINSPAIILFDVYNYYSLERIFSNKLGKHPELNFFIKESEFSKRLLKDGWHIETKRDFIFSKGVYMHLPYFLGKLIRILDFFLSYTPLKYFCGAIFYKIIKE